jgi:hypothetical protein
MVAVYLVLGSRWMLDTKNDWPTDCRLKHNFGFDLIDESLIWKILEENCRDLTDVLYLGWENHHSLNQDSQYCGRGSIRERP